jgi:DNA-binding SARP family transcriptional activator
MLTSTELTAPMLDSETPSPAALIERGLNYARHGYFAEASALFSEARAGLSQSQPRLIEALETLILSYNAYWQVQQQLHDASRRFAQVSAEQQTCLNTVEQLVAGLDGQGSEMGTREIEFITSNPQPPTPNPQPLPFEPETDNLPALYITCFGRFEVQRLGRRVELCANRNGQALLRYLVSQPHYRESMDILIDIMWPEDEPEIARHKLRVAISALRRSLNSGYVHQAGGGYILCKNEVYQLNPAGRVQTDVDEFLAFYQAGRQATGQAAVSQYEKACQLYTGPFLIEDLYADWSQIRREQLTQIYLIMGNSLAEHYLEAGCCEEAIHWASAILKENRCDEGAHRQLIRAYTCAGRRSEALQQYQRCKQILNEELGVEPMPQTQQLFNMVSGKSELETLSDK